ncbi:MAG: SDR family oxidoreductase [Syntrophobacteraceae bacterium]|jgi:nucleoside-diphosphate-sugar epimerase
MMTGRKANAAVCMRAENEDSKPSVFLTGGTGFLGGHLAAAFLKAGRQVILLARPKSGKSADERVSSLFDWLEVRESLRWQVRVVTGDILLPGLGLAPQLMKDLKLKGCDFIHCASDTSFSERRRSDVEAVNVNGLSNVLNFAASSGAGFLHLVSTAYVAGRKSGRCPEEPAEPVSYTNVYEETKCRGEWVAQEICRRAGIGLAVYRPSIVYGDSQTGRSLSFNSLYHPVRTLQFLRKVYEKDILERGGAKAASIGIRMSRDGVIHFPLRIEVGGNGGINLVPINFFVDAFQALMAEARDGDFFHIVSESLTPISELIDYTENFLKLEGLRACQPEQMAETPRNAVERLFAHYTETYGPYMKDERIFTAERSRHIIQRRGIVCPEFEENVFNRCMAYAVSVDWGAKLFAC